MEPKSRTLRPNQCFKGQSNGTGRVREYSFGRSHRLYQITTFCPEFEGPGATHLYLIETDKIILVDTGIPTGLIKPLFYGWRGQAIPKDLADMPDDYSEQELVGALRLAGHDMSDIDFIVITHGHYDHYCMGKRLVELSGAKTAAHVFDIPKIINPFGLLESWMRYMDFIIAMGMPLPDLSRVKSKGSQKNATYLMNEELSLQVDYPIVAEGPLRLGEYVSKSIDVIHTPGHTSGGISLLLRDEENHPAAILVGDTILYPITPLPDDLISYLRTLNKLDKIQNVGIALPAHAKVINQLDQRIDFLRRHHRRRLKYTYELCKKPQSIWQIATASRYFNVAVDPKKFNPLAGQEVYVHLELLQLVDALHRTHIDNNVHFFKNSSESFDAVYERIQDLIENRSITALLRRSF